MGNDACKIQFLTLTLIFLEQLKIELYLQRGDTIEIIAMNPSGLWQGKSQGRIGHFKFINVELLPDRNTLRQQRRSASEKVPNYTNSGPPKTVEELLKRIGLEVSQIQIYTVFENHRKSLINKFQNWPFGEFLKTWKRSNSVAR